MYSELLEFTRVLALFKYSKISSLYMSQVGLLEIASTLTTIVLMSSGLRIPQRASSGLKIYFNELVDVKRQITDLII